MRLRRVRRASYGSLGVLAFLLTVGCGDGRPFQLAVRDSAGVTIVENPISFASARACTLASEPRLTIGSVDGPIETQFFRVWRAKRLHNGEIAVVNQGTNELRVFDSHGAFIATIGREGGGPNEFRRMWDFWQKDDDSLVIWDYRQQRLSTVDVSGGFGGSVTLDPPFRNPPTIVGLTPDNGFLLWERVRAGEDGTEMRESIQLHTYDGTGQRTSSLDAYPNRVLRQIPVPGIPFSAGDLFEATPQVALGTTFYAVTTAAEPTLWLHDLAGKPIRVIRWRDRERRVTEEAVSAYYARRFSEAASEQGRQVVRALQEHQRVAERFPVTSYVTVDQVDRIWVWDYERPGTSDMRRALVFAATGEILCRVETLPSAGFVADLGDDWVLTVEPDSNDVEFVHLYSVLGL